MKRKIITIMLIIISVAMCKIESHAVVGTYSDYEEGKVNYDEIGEASFGYCDTDFYNKVYFEKSIRDDEIGKINTRNRYDAKAGNYVTYYNLIVKYGTESINDIASKVSVLDRATWNYKDVDAVWKYEDIPVGAFSHPEGYEFKLTGVIEGVDKELIVSVLPSASLNEKRPAAGLKFEKVNDGYSNGTFTGNFNKHPGIITFILNDGSRLVGGQAVIDGSTYYFDEQGIAYFGEYRDGYFYDDDGKRVEDKKYSWSTDGDYKIYADNTGSRIKLEYALIDGTLHFFDGLGHEWQTFDYPAYSLKNDNVLMGVPVSFDNVDKQKIIDRIVEIRKEAVKLGIIKSYTVPKWSYALERGNMIRACEAAIFSKSGHSRPAKNAAKLKFDGFNDCSEWCLAWGNGGSLSAISMYYSELNSVLKKDGGVTGHYYALLSGDYIGTASVDMGEFNTTSEDYDYDFDNIESWDSSNAYGSLSSDRKEKINEEKIDFSPYSIQLIEIGKDQVDVVKNQKYVSKVHGTLIYTYNLDGIRNKTGEGNLIKKKGKYYFKYLDGSFAKNDWLNLNGKHYYFDYDGVGIECREGTKVTYGGIQYKLHDIKLKDGLITGGTAEAVKVKEQYYRMSVYGSIYMGSAEFPVTKIAPSMAKNKNRIYYLYIGENVAFIGKNAFSGCSRLKELYIYSKKLKTSKVKKAFSKTPSWMKVYVPKKKLNAYKKLLRKKGISKKVKFKKIK